LVSTSLWLSSSSSSSSSSCFQRATLTATAVQQFFVPLPEASLMKDGFYAINPIAGQELTSGWGWQQELVCAPGIVNTMIGMTISTDGTVVFWGTSMCLSVCVSI